MVFLLQHLLFAAAVAALLLFAELEDLLLDGRLLAQLLLLDLHDERAIGRQPVEGLLAVRLAAGHRTAGTVQQYGHAAGLVHLLAAAAAALGEGLFNILGLNAQLFGLLEQSGLEVDGEAHTVDHSKIGWTSGWPFLYFGVP